MAKPQVWHTLNGNDFTDPLKVDDRTRMVQISFDECIHRYGHHVRVLKGTKYRQFHKLANVESISSQSLSEYVIHDTIWSIILTNLAVNQIYSS